MKFKLFVNRGRANGKSFAQREYDAEMAKRMAEGKVRPAAMNNTQNTDDSYEVDRRHLIELALTRSALTPDEAREAYGRASILFADGKPVEVIPSCDQIRSDKLYDSAIELLRKYNG